MSERRIRTGGDLVVQYGKQVVLDEEHRADRCALAAVGLRPGGAEDALDEEAEPVHERAGLDALAVLAFDVGHLAACDQ